MTKHFLLSFSTLAICVCAVSSHAQVFPIQSQVNLSPPYSGNLADYTSPGSQRIRVTITSKDPMLSNFRVKLRFTIEGLGITVRTKQNLVVDPFVLDGGSPLVLYGDDLLQHLNPQNLDFVGFSRAEYQRTGKFPEGVYRFYVEVLDYNRGTVVSNKGFTTAWIILNDPPILNLPANNSKVRIIDPTNIAFTWTPRHTGSPNAAFTTEYVFRLIEVWPSNRNPNDAFLSQTPFFEIETSQSQIVYGPGEPGLIPGRKYAWQVQARDTEGRDLFKNFGKSEAFVFQFGDALDLPQNVRKETANATTISIRWEASSSGEIPERFRIRYRVEGGTIWFEDVTTQYWHTLSGLQNNKAYDIQVRAETATQVSDYTFNQRHRTTLPVADPDFQCGNPFTPIKYEMTTPLERMKPGDVFRFQDFDVEVTEVSEPSTPGFFSGKGYAKVLMMNRANIEVAFSGTFNKELQLVKGSMRTTYAPGNKIDRLKKSMEQIGADKPVLDADKENASSTLITITGIVDSVYLGVDGKIVVLNEDGTSQTYDYKTNGEGEKQDMVVKDAAGNTWTVDKDGKITKADAAVAGVYASRDSLNFVVKFKESETHHYGFDKDNSFPTSQPSKLNEKDYFIGWKSVAQGRKDAIDAYVEGTGKFPGKVGFKTETQSASKQPGKDSNASTVLITGGMPDSSEELIAYAKVKEAGKDSESELILGKLNVVSYEAISKKLIIVPVNETTTLTELQVKTELNKIYGQAVASWEVAISSVFEIDETLLENFDEEESGNLASYNQKMREFNRAYKKANPNYDRETYYIFLIKGTAYRFDAFMPFKRNFGYVFTDKLNNNNQKITQTIAHELGHGAFHLKHTFSQHAIAQGSTQNLMDYGDGKELKKYQWDYVHDPESVIGWFEEDEEGAVNSSSSLPFEVTIGDTVMTKNKLYIRKPTDEAIYFKYNTTANDTTSKVKVRIVVRYPDVDIDEVIPGADQWKTVMVNTNTNLQLDSIPEGKYKVIVKKGTETELSFYVRRKEYDFACSVCGRDLSVSLETLKKIFPKNASITANHATIFTTALKAGSINTCNRQAHLFAQCKVESNNFAKFSEAEGYTVKRFFQIFSGNKNIDAFFQQAFWDNNSHKNYFFLSVYEKLDTTLQGTHMYNDSIKITRDQISAIVPVGFKDDSTGHYKKSIFTSAQKQTTKENLFSLVYANNVGTGNGPPETKDGYNYKGRGMIQLTGRTTYQDVSTKANSVFVGEDFDWIANPLDLENEDKDKIYSGIAFFHWKLNGNLSLLDGFDPFPVSVKVNGCKKKNKANICIDVNHKSEREQYYKSLRKTVFYE